MQIQLIKIGNSKGIRLPNSVIKACHLSDIVRLEVHEGVITIQAEASPRKGWQDTFEKNIQKKEAGLLDGYISTQWDETEGEW